MRSDDAIVRVDHVADISAGPDAAAGKRLGLQDLDHVVLQELSELVLRVQTLARRDRNG